MMDGRSRGEYTRPLPRQHDGWTLYPENPEYGVHVSMRRPRQYAATTSPCVIHVSMMGADPSTGLRSISQKTTKRNFFGFTSAHAVCPPPKMNAQIHISRACSRKNLAAITFPRLRPREFSGNHFPPPAPAPPAAAASSVMRRSLSSIA
eukprot:TRINITY_DN768_c0_g1_i2.p2 TRINITY_DN768_c0_g1~~TRINITY_DN768_c0_g1_i2.p2  ORF type:complete len:149 (-),score=5.55 TRINITY_DN768_c0_g1_i2:442-888(-)